MAEPHTPRWMYHCREHPEERLMKYNHLHFQEGHEGKDPNRLRYRCAGALCTYCLKMLASQDDDENVNNDAGELSAPKKTPDM